MEKILEIKEAVHTTNDEGWKQTYEGYEIITDKQKIVIAIDNCQDCCEEYIMRLNKYRGISKTEHKFIHGTFVKGALDMRTGNMINYAIQIPGCMIAIAVDPETVGQYTGFDDIHKMPIIEHDTGRVKMNLETIIDGEIIWKNGAFKFKPETGNDYYLSEVFHELEITGNIHKRKDFNYGKN